MNTHFDVIVVGGGHAGIEAAHAAAKMGSKTALITLEISKIGLMPCNPAIGGVGKGHIVYEVSALGGLMPKLCTSTYLQARMLNTRKGPAVQGLRLQIDKHAYNQRAVQTLSNFPNLTLIEGVVDDIDLETPVESFVHSGRTGENSDHTFIQKHEKVATAPNLNQEKDKNPFALSVRRVSNVVLKDGRTFSTSAVILTTGTFLCGKIHIGKETKDAGRRDEQAVTGLSAFLKRAQLKLGRLKTGTPPRLARSSIDFSKLEKQEADNLEYLFELYPHKVVNKRDCYITHTNATTHQIIRDNLDQSAMYSGAITGIGPRYCPSIEDKIARFPLKESHQIFVEPEGIDDEEIYPNGISTSLPLDIQKQYIQSIVGFEQAVITKAGYAVEYDFVLPNQLSHTLEVKSVPGLFLAGQINGTTGYEEAAGQGILAGINAHQKVQKKEPFILDRNESYIGVMVDDLVSMGVDEPYRMFTSRAERRLLLRQDNTFLRLTDYGYKLGMIDQKMYQDFCTEREWINQTLKDLRSGPQAKEIQKMFGDGQATKEMLKPYIANPISERALLTVFAELSYAPYLEREHREAERTKQYKELSIPKDFSYIDMPGLSKELQQKLTRYQPATIAHASLIPGMTPAALSLLILKIRMLYR